ncbi:MAG: hypothetical protein ACFCD0_17610 [Gemmataceae bacterium]
MGKKGGMGGQKGGGSKAGSKAGSPSAKKGSTAKAKGGQGGGKAGAKGQGSPKAGSKGGGKGGSKAGGSKGGGQKGGGQKGGGQKGGGQKGGGQKGGGQKGGQQGGEKKETLPARERIQEGGQHQQDAGKKIGNNQEDNEKAIKDQEEAIKDLKEAKQKLEDIIRQLREQELERVLQSLQSRCVKMRDDQLVVLDATKGLMTQIAKTDKKSTTKVRANEARSIKLAGDEEKIVKQATDAIQMLEAEGSAVAFPEVFKQLREDMVQVQERFNEIKVDVITVGIEEDIVQTLEEMIEALKKAQKDLKKKKQDSKSGKKKGGGGKKDQKLLDLIAELKMIRSMQLRINKRTTDYGRAYKGEQASDTTIRRELRELADRQLRIVGVTNKIATGENN